MIQLIVQVNPRAGKEQVVYEKLNEVFNKPTITKIEQLSDFYLVLKFDGKIIEKITSIQDCEDILDIQIMPANIVFENRIPVSEKDNQYIVYVKTDKGKRELVMKNLTENKKLGIYYAAYFFDDRADIILDIFSKDMAAQITNAIRETEGVQDTTIYNLPTFKKEK